ncbi:hypothetical protein TRVA0_002S03378 [Trichomonascus vanleenenianus]|uniref:uncharacterized protein n=1 Tax=Trichomonascus vanleenenianus TaxID=2268995 RepID=UPI003ECB0944
MMRLIKVIIPLLFISISSAFHLVSVRDGVPYLDNRTVHVSDNQLVLNDDHSQELDATVIEGHLYCTHRPAEEELYIDSSSKAILCGQPKAGITILPGQWSVNSTELVKFNNESNIWACAYNKSGIYKLYWLTEFNPACLAGLEIWLKRAD